MDWIASGVFAVPVWGHQRPSLGSSRGQGEQSHPLVSLIISLVNLLHDSQMVVIPAGATLVFSVMMTSLSTKYYQFILAQGVLGGIACGMIFTPVVSTVGQYFTTRRAWAMGIVVSGAAIGGIVFPIALNRLLNMHRVGFGWAVRVVGFIMLALLAYAGIVTKEFAPRRKKNIFLPGAFKKWPYVLTNAGFLIGLMGLYAPIFYISDYSLDQGMDPQLALYQVAILNAPSFFGRTIPNFAGDKLGRFNITIITYVACAVLCFCWTAATSTAGITVWVIFFGFFSGAAFSLYSPTVAQGMSTIERLHPFPVFSETPSNSNTLHVLVCPDPSDIGTYVGQGLAVCSFGALAGTPINGALIRHYSYLSASMFSGAALVVGTICQITARLFLEKQLFVVV